MKKSTVNSEELSDRAQLWGILGFVSLIILIPFCFMCYLSNDIKANIKIINIWAIMITCISVGESMLPISFIVGLAIVPISFAFSPFGSIISITICSVVTSILIANGATDLFEGTLKVKGLTLFSSYSFQVAVVFSVVVYFNRSILFI